MNTYRGERESECCFCRLEPFYNERLTRVTRSLPFRFFPHSQILCDYFGVLEEESIRDNFVLIYELLGEHVRAFKGALTRVWQALRGALEPGLHAEERARFVVSLKGVPESVVALMGARVYRS